MEGVRRIYMYSDTTVVKTSELEKKKKKDVQLSDKEQKKKEEVDGGSKYMYTRDMSVVKTHLVAKKQFITELSDNDLDMSASLRPSV